MVVNLPTTKEVCDKIAKLKALHQKSLIRRIITIFRQQRKHLELDQSFNEIKEIYMQLFCRNQAELANMKSMRILIDLHIIHQIK
jgi:molybdopterin/thiamine biosynthesis adenylyltransferase